MIDKLYNDWFYSASQNITNHQQVNKVYVETYNTKL